MSFTQVAIEAQFTNADGSAASGTVCVTPNSTLHNGTESQDLQSICGTLDSEGRLIAQSGEALVVNATDDAGTTPIGSSYSFQVKLDGQFLYEFDSLVPSSSSDVIPLSVTDTVTLVSGSNQITLNSLVVSSTMIGKTLTGTGITGTATITAINAATNTLTINENATASETSTITILSAAVSLFALKANAL